MKTVKLSNPLHCVCPPHPESQAGSEPVDSCKTRRSSKSTKAPVSAYRGKVSQSNKEELWGQRSLSVGERELQQRCRHSEQQENKRIHNITLLYIDFTMVEKSVFLQVEFSFTVVKSLYCTTFRGLCAAWNRIIYIYI